MSLDPHIGGLLDFIASSGAKPMWEGTVDEARTSYRALTVGTRAPEQIPQVKSVEDITVPGAEGELKARVYRPLGDGPVPTVAFFHGGGWVIGDLDTHDAMAREVCKGANAVVVSVDYRMGPEHHFPAAPRDAVASARWIKQRTADFGGNDLFGVAGDSAGGNLSAVVSQQLHADGIEVDAQLLIYPAVDPLGDFPSRTENGKGYFLEQASMDWFGGHYVTETTNPNDPLLAPLKAESLAGLAPAVIATAEFDPLRDEGEVYGQELAKAGVKVDVKRGEGLIHGCFDMGHMSPAAQAFVDERVQRFGEVLRGA